MLMGGIRRYSVVFGGIRYLGIPDCLNALILMFVHRDIELDYKEIIDIYATDYPHRMLFLNPLPRTFLPLP